MAVTKTYSATTVTYSNAALGATSNSGKLYTVPDGVVVKFTTAVLGTNVGTLVLKINSLSADTVGQIIVGNSTWANAAGSQGIINGSLYAIYMKAGDYISISNTAGVAQAVSLYLGLIQEVTIYQ